MIPPAERRFDVLGLGCVAVDDLLYVPAYPAVDQKARVIRAVRQCGGLTGTALVAAARLGGRCAFAGCLGTDWPSDFVVANFAREGVDTTEAPRLADGCVVHSTIVVGQDCGSRNVFYHVDGLLGAHPELPANEILRQTRVIFMDDYGMEGNLRAAKLARASGVAIVSDFEVGSGPVFSEVFELVDHLVLSEAAAIQFSRADDAPSAALRLWNDNRETVIVTCGREGCWSVAKGDESRPRHHPAFPVNTADTTGCGDVFHGAYALALARGDGLDARIYFASAAAAVKATQTTIPTAAELEVFLANSPQPSVQL